MIGCTPTIKGFIYYLPVSVSDQSCHMYPQNAVCIVHYAFVGLVRQSMYYNLSFSTNLISPKLISLCT